MQKFQCLVEFKNKNITKSCGKLFLQFITIIKYNN